jgi:hypothetical protein
VSSTHHMSCVLNVSSAVITTATIAINTARTTVTAFLLLLLLLELKKLNSVALVRKRTIPTERPPIVGEVSANLCG